MGGNDGGSDCQKGGLKGLAVLGALGAGLGLAGGPEALAWSAGMLAALEFACTTMYAVADSGLKSVRQKLWEANPNIFARDEARATTLFDRFLRHPLLSHVNHNNPPAGRAPATNGVLRANSEGFIGWELPPRRPDDCFAIFISGGSVAERFAHTYHTPGGVVAPVLEDLLNERYLPPDSLQRFRVFNAAVGAWKQPQQLAMLCLSTHRTHAFVCLEGYNETMAGLIGVQERGLRFEYPWLNLYAVEQSAERKLCLRLMRGVYETVLGDALLSRSRLAYLCSTLARGLLEALARQSEAALRELPMSLGSIFKRAEGACGDPLAWSCEQYAMHLQSMDAVAKRHDVRLAVFLQPCAGIGKVLTEQERRICTRQGYQDHYRNMEATLFGLAGEGMHAASLLDVFEGVAESVYIDDAHINPPTLDAWGRGTGHRLVAERMAAHLADWWGLKPRAGEG